MSDGLLVMWSIVGVLMILVGIALISIGMKAGKK